MATDDLCGKLKLFETAKPQKGDDPKERRWVEFHWNFDHGETAIWSWGCLHSKQAIAKVTCDWLMGNTNQEFAMILPQDIMSCYGYRFPEGAFNDWDNMLGTIRLRSVDGRELDLDLNYRDLPKGEAAMRLSLGGPGQKYEPKKLPPIAPMPHDAK